MWTKALHLAAVPGIIGRKFHNNISSFCNLRIMKKKLVHFLLALDLGYREEKERYYITNTDDESLI